MFWAGVWAWLKKVPGEVWFIVVAVSAAIVGIYIVDKNAVKRTKQKNKIEELEEVVVLQQESKVIVDAVEQRVEDAREAVARMPQFSSVDELWARDPALAKIILGDPSGHER